MASNELIDDIISQQAFAQVDKMKGEMEALMNKFIQAGLGVEALNKALTDAKGLGALTSNISTATQATTQYIDAGKQILDLQKKIALATSAEGEEIAKLRLQLQALNASNKDRVKDSQAEEGSINSLRVRLKELQKGYDDMGKAMRESFKGTTILADIQKVDAELKKLEGGSGRFQRNVGNYSNATFQLSQSLRELPAFAFSAQTGILALSNNLPMLVDSFNQVKASTGSAGSALAVFGRSIFTFTNLFTIALGLFTVFYQDIMKFVGVTKTAKEGVDELKKAFDSSIQSGYTEVAVLKMLYDKSQDVSKSLQERKKSVDELQKIYPQYFGNLKDEEILAGKAKDAYLALNDALLDTIITRAYYSQADIIGQNIVKNTMMVEELNTQLVKLQSNSTKSGEMIYSRDAQGLTEYINKIKQIPAIGEELANKIASSGESGVFGAIKKVRDDLSNSITKSEGDLQRLLNMVDYMYGDKVKDKVSGKSNTGKPKKEQEDEIFTVVPPDLTPTQEEIDNITNYYERLNKERIKILGEYFNDPKVQEAIAKDLALPEIPFEELKLNPKKVVIDEESIRKAIALYANSSLDALTTINEIIEQNIMSEFDKKQRASDRYYEDEELKVKQSGKSKQQQEKELIKLEAQRAAQNRAIERDKVNEQRKAAKRQKMIDVAQAISNTALAVGHALSDKSVPYYLAVANAVSAGIIGAAQVAAIVATPLPQFAKGTENSPEGYAIVGEKGTELVTDPSGKSWLTPAKDTITYLKKGSKVTTNEKLMEMVKNSAYVQLANLNTPVTSDLYTKTLIEKFEENTNELKALKGIMQDKAMSVQIQGNYDHYIHVRNNIR